MEKSSVQEILTTGTDPAVSPEAGDKLLQDYEITAVTLEGVKLFRSPVLDLEAAEEKVLSSAGLREGKNRYRIFFLLKRAPGQNALEIVERAVQGVLRDPAGEEAGAVLPAVRLSDCGNIPDWFLRNLLLGALESGPQEPERSRIGNGLTLYWGPGRDDRELTAFNYRFDAQGVFHQNVITFTALSRFPRNRKGELLDRSLESEPLYRFFPERKMFIRAFAPEAGENLYVRIRRPGRAGEDTLWSSIPASEEAEDKDLAQRWKEFEDSRLKELWKVVRNFNETYGKYGVDIRFQSFDQTEAEKTGGMRRAFSQTDGKPPGREMACVVNTDPAREKDAEELAEALKASGFRLRIQTGKEPDPAGINLIFIHGREYTEKTGILDSQPAHPEFQYVTYEAWEERKRDRPGLAQYWLMEAWERRDILWGRITLADCSMLPETMYFAKDFYDPNRKKHHDMAMRLEPDGSIEIACSGSPEFERCFPGWDPQWFRCERHRDNAEYAVRMSSNLNLIRYTGVRALVYPCGTAETYDGQKGVNPEGTGAITVRTFRMDRKNCFICGIQYGGRGGELETGPMVREIIPIGESRILIEDLLPLMMVDSVRLNQLAIVPFPLRYMREYLRVVGQAVNSIPSGENGRE